ncbi:SRPBCC family protein [Parapedobacter tibetensis]|uniref:SRPBCC family protein n=1 Tax=Parapedobacter tibetensis TaxID=2972951 RepID=UPI00214D1656|nr:SRPBCC domain-containing protein [Parapedobacter tibetensis]
MENQDFSTTILVDQSPQEVFNAVNNVRAWWSATTKGNTVNLHDEFMVDFGSHWWALRIIETVPDQKVGWQVSGSYMPWNEDQYEWTGTTVNFEISRSGTQTKLRFIHSGLVPQFSCFQGCSKGWAGYINISLKNLITTGIGTPDFPY